MWNVTRRCNLKCVHCYSHSEDCDYPDELSLNEGISLIDDLAEFGSPVILFSGGEPLIRRDILALIETCREQKNAGCIVYQRDSNNLGCRYKAQEDWTSLRWHKLGWFRKRS